MQPVSAVFPGREAQEKAEKREKAEKGEKGEKPEKKRDWTGALLGGGILIWLGISLYITRTEGVRWTDWWGYFVAGIGVLLIVMGAARAALPTHRGRAIGPFVGGVVLAIIGLSGIYGIQEFWPFVLVGIGLAIIVSAVVSRGRSPAP